MGAMLSTLLLISQLLEQIKAKETVYPSIFDRVKADREIREKLVVQESVLTPPVIIEVTPKKGGAGTGITLRGQNFAKDNLVYTGFGTVKAKSVDGKTLKFKLPKPPFWSSAQNQAAVTEYWRKTYPNGKVSIPLGFYLKNDLGQSVAPGTFTFEF